jgi:hypothetical protein
MREISMTLHVDSSTIRNQTVLATVLDPVDDPTAGRSDAGQGTTSSSTDSAAISLSGQRLAAIGGEHGDELAAINDAETLVRSISASLRSSSSSSTAALHGSIDRSRAAALLVD